MPPKKKASEAAVPSTSIPPPPEQPGGGVDTGGSTDIDEEAHDAARSGGKAAQTSTSALVPRPSREAQDRQRHGTRSTIRLLGQDRAGGSRGAQDQHARQHADTSETRSPGRDTAPSNVVRSLSISRSSHHSPLPPTTPAEALARAQLLLDYPHPKTRSTDGGPPFRVSSASPTVTLHGSRVHHGRGRTARREPMETRPLEV